MNFSTMGLEELRDVAVGAITELRTRQATSKQRIAEGETTLQDIAGTVATSYAPPPRTSVGSNGSGSGRSSRNNKWNYLTGTLELALRYDGSGGLSKDEYAAKIRSELNYVTKAKDDTAFGNSLYVSGINKAMQMKLLESHGGKYFLTVEGKRAAEENRK